MDAGDSQLVTLLATDLKRSYERLVLTYWHPLKAFILRQGGIPQDAEDIVQEAFVRAYYALEIYPQQRILALKVRPWLYKITWSVYCNHMEHAKLRPAIPLDTSENSAFLELQDAEREQPEEAFESGERTRELIALVDTLPQHYREVVRLHYFEDLRRFRRPGLLCARGTNPAWVEFDATSTSDASSSRTGTQRSLSPGMVGPP